MKKFVQIALITAFVYGLFACGSVNHRIAVQPQNNLSLKQVKLMPVEVISKEQNSDALALNAQCKEIATYELQILLQDKNISLNNSDIVVDCLIYVVYGDRALRYCVGFGAGSGYMSVTIELKNVQGTVLYATNSQAVLTMGLFGGDMSQVARNTIVAAVKEFGIQL